MRAQSPPARTPRQVLHWRRGQLLQTGFPLALAVVLASDPRYDLHAIIQLVERGCPPRLAARILAPSDEGSAT